MGHFGAAGAPGRRAAAGGRYDGRNARTATAKSPKDRKTEQATVKQCNRQQGTPVTRHAITPESTKARHAITLDAGRWTLDTRTMSRTETPESTSRYHIYKSADYADGDGDGDGDRLARVV